MLRMRRVDNQSSRTGTLSLERCAPPPMFRRSLPHTNMGTQRNQDLRDGTGEIVDRDENGGEKDTDAKAEEDDHERLNKVDECIDCS